MGEVFKWIKAEGGLEAMAERNEAKARVLYDDIDRAAMFGAGAAGQPLADERLLLRGASEELDEQVRARKRPRRGLDGLKGHRVGRRHAREHLQCDAARRA